MRKKYFKIKYSRHVFAAVYMTNKLHQQQDAFKNRVILNYILILGLDYRLHNFHDLKASSRSDLPSVFFKKGKLGIA